LLTILLVLHRSVQRFTCWFGKHEPGSTRLIVPQTRHVTAPNLLFVGLLLHGGRESRTRGSPQFHYLLSWSGRLNAHMLEKGRVNVNPMGSCSIFLKHVWSKMRSKWFQVLMRSKVTIDSHPCVITEPPSFWQQEVDVGLLLWSSRPNLVKKVYKYATLAVHYKCGECR
jgi:hypothetical protein